MYALSLCCIDPGYNSIGFFCKVLIFGGYHCPLCWWSFLHLKQFSLFECVINLNSGNIPGLHGLPTRSGKLKDITKFDCSFFGVNPKQADAMDPQLRLLLEVAYEAIIDAGLSGSQQLCMYV